jgi:hypothetical protein
MGHLVRVVLDHWRSCVFGNIEGLVERDAYCDRRGYSALGHLISIDEQGANCRFSNAASLVVEAEAHHVAGRDRIIRRDTEFVVRLVRERARELWPAVLHKWSPTTEAPRPLEAQGYA